MIYWWRGVSFSGITRIAVIILDYLFFFFFRKILHCFFIICIKMQMQTCTIANVAQIINDLKSVATFLYVKKSISKYT